MVIAELTVGCSGSSVGEEKGFSDFPAWWLRVAADVEPLQNKSDDISCSQNRRNAHVELCLNA